MVGHDSQARIAPLVSRTISSFDSLLSALEERTPETPVAVSHYSRFKLWVGSMGAHRPSGGRSLEYRLRDASSMKNQITSLLEDLCDSVAQGIPAAQGAAGRELLEDTDDNPVLDSTDAELEDYFQDDGDVEQSDMGRVLDDIGHVVDCLLRLSMAIRNPAPHDHFLSRIKADAVDHFEEWDVKHVQEKFPNADTGIAERLGRASARRRHYLRYREEHTRKIADGIEPVFGLSEGDEREKATTIASSIPSHLKEGRVGAEPTAQFTGFSDSESNVSMTSYAPSTANTSQLRVPRLPKECETGPFKCPFCCMIVSIKTRRDWKNHVFRDLRPYVCVYQSCTKPDQQYQRRADWIDHMKQEHWRTWKCPFGCPGTFASPRDFENHINEDHPTEIQAPSLDALQTLTSNADSSKAKGDCALCRDFRVASERQYGSHVGTHLEQLSLFALPHAGDHDDESCDESGGDIPNKYSNETSEGESTIYWQVPVPLVHFGYQNAKSRGGRGRKGKKGLCGVARCFQTRCSAFFDDQEGFSRYCPQHTCAQVLTPAEGYYCPIPKDPTQRLCPKHLQLSPLDRDETGSVWINSFSRTPASDRPSSPLYVSDDEDPPRAIQHHSENRPDAARKEETVEEELYTIKCICNTSEDDGNTIYCERCDTWQHIQCYYPDNVEEALREDFSHSCADCEPRPLDRKQAIDRQTERAAGRYVEPLDSQDKSQSESEESSGEEGEVAGSMQVSPVNQAEMDDDEGKESPPGQSNSQPADRQPRPDQLPMYRPEIIRNIDFLTDEEKIGYEKEARALWKKYQIAQGAIEKARARSMIVDFGMMLESKVTPRKQAFQAQQAQQQGDVSDAEKRCAFCERRGHDSIDCPYEDVLIGLDRYKREERAYSGSSDAPEGGNTSRGEIGHPRQSKEEDTGEVTVPQPTHGQSHEIGAAMARLHVDVLADRLGLASDVPTTSASLDQLPMPSYDTQEPLPLSQSTGMDLPHDVKARLDDIEARFLEFEASCREFIKNYETQSDESRRRVLLQALERIQLRLRAIATENETLENRKQDMVVRVKYIEEILEKARSLRGHMGPD